MNRTANPKVSVVVPNYNHARFLRRRIDSVLQQTYQDFELILLDDCSPDDSREILSSYAGDPRVRLQFNTVNSGNPFKQWNKGVRLARGEYVWIAESDDFADERLLERLVEVLEAEPKASFAYCQSWRVSAEGQLDGFADFYFVHLDPTRWKADYCMDGREECEKHFLFENTAPNASAVVFRRALYESIRGADENLSLCADWKLWAAMALEGKVAFVSEPLNYFRFHSNTARGRDATLVRGAEESLVIVPWLLHQVTIPDAALEKIFDMLAHHWTLPLLRRDVTLKRKWVILRNAMAVDRFAMLRLARYGSRAAIQTLVKNPLRIWVWHPILDATRPVRHALGLKQR
jgi:glycosyltransferase involved in cell wall biosynthesis